MKTVCSYMVLLAMLASCGSDSGPPLSATDIAIIAPLPGRSGSAAYMTLHNGSDKAIILNEVSSPLFARVEMHESTITDGIARMRKLESLAIAAGSSVQFAVGGKHLMLIDPVKGLIPGDSISLEMHYDDGGIVIFGAPLRTRQNPGGNQ